MFAILYILLLLALVMFSWIASVYGFVLPDGELLPSLLSADSFRWFLRHSIDNIAGVPIVYVLLVLMMIGTVRSCGVLNYFSHLLHEGERPFLTRRQQYASRVAWVVFGGCMSMILWGVLSPKGNLLSVTGHLAGGPLACGWLFVLSVIVCVPCLVYGCLGGLWQTPQSVLKAFTAEIARCSDYFVTYIVASQLIAALHYTQMFQLLQWQNTTMTLFQIIVYGAPLIATIHKDIE